jgi:hypothetical protein
MLGFRSLGAEIPLLRCLGRLGAYWGWVECYWGWMGAIGVGLGAIGIWLGAIGVGLGAYIRKTCVLCT